MKRRNALKSVAILLGTAISATTLNTLFEGCNSATKSGIVNFNKEFQEVLIAFSEIIIPATDDSGGATAADVVPEIQKILNDCYPKEQVLFFQKGLETFCKKLKDKFELDFIALSSDKKMDSIKQLRELALKQNKINNEEGTSLYALDSQENKKSPQRLEDDAQAYFFITGRDLTFLTYYTSEIGCTKALAYVDIPGRYDGNVPLKPGQKRWA